MRVREHMTQSGLTALVKKARPAYNEGVQGSSLTSFCREASMLRLFSAVAFAMLVCLPTQAKPTHAPQDDAKEKQGKTRETVDADALAGRVYCILKKRCTECHGATSTEKPVDILNIGAHKTTFFAHGNGESEELIEYLESGYMPKGRPRLRDHEIADIKDWIKANAPAFPPGIDCDGGAKEKMAEEKTYTPEHVIRTIAKDILDQSKNFGGNPRNVPYVYFSMAHLKGTGEGDAEVKYGLYSDALKWAVNLTSMGNDIVVPQPVDPGGWIWRVDPRLLREPVDRNNPQQVQAWSAGAFARLKNADPYLGQAALQRRGQLSQNPTLKPYLDKAINSTLPLDYFVAKMGDQAPNFDMSAIPQTQTQTFNGYRWQDAVNDAALGSKTYPAHMYHVSTSNADKANVNRGILAVAFPQIGPNPLRPSKTRYPLALISLNYDNNAAGNNMEKAALTGVRGVRADLQSTTNSQDEILMSPNGLPKFTRHNSDGTLHKEIIDKGPKFCWSCHLSRGPYEFKDEGYKVIEASLNNPRMGLNEQAMVRNLFVGEEQKKKDLKVFADTFQAAKSKMQLRANSEDKETIDPRIRETRLDESNKIATNWGGSAPVLVGDLFNSTPYDLDRMAHIFGTTPEVIKDVIGGNNILRDNLNNPNLEHFIVQPDKFRINAPAISALVPQRDLLRRGKESPYYVGPK